MAKGIDVRQSTDRLQFRAFLQANNGSLVTSGTCNLRLYELQDGGALFSYDWNDNLFKSTALTTEHQTMTHRQGNNNTTDTGIWTFDLTTLTDFVKGSIYFMQVDHTGASPQVQTREFQFGEEQGDGLVEAVDVLLRRDMSAVTGEAARSPLNALRFLRNRFNIVSGTLTVYKEDDATSAWTTALTTDAAADPITQSDPA